MTGDLAGADLALADEVAALLCAADGGDESAERELAKRYAGDDRLNPRGRVECRSPSGAQGAVDLGTRRVVAAQPT